MEKDDQEVEIRKERSERQHVTSKLEEDIQLFLRMLAEESKDRWNANTMLEEERKERQRADRKLEEMKAKYTEIKAKLKQALPAAVQLPLAHTTVGTPGQEEMASRERNTKKPITKDVETTNPLPQH